MVVRRKTVYFVLPRSIVVSFLVCCFVFIASATQKELSLIIFVSERDGQERDGQHFKVLEQAIETQLSDLGVQVSLEESSNIHAINTRADVEKLIIQKAVSVAMVVRDNSLLLLYDDGISKEFVERELPAGERFEDSCDAVASMVRSSIEHLLYREAVDNIHSDDNDEDDDSLDSDDETRDGDESNADEIDSSPSEVGNAELDTSVASKKTFVAWAGARIGLGVDLAYVMQVIRTVDPIRHGGYLGVRMRLTPYGALSVGAELLQPSRFKLFDWSFTYRRIPLRVTLAGYWPLKRVKLGVYASLLVDFTRIDGGASNNDENESLDGSQRFGTAPSDEPSNNPRPRDDNDRYDDDRRDDRIDFNDTVLNAVTPSFSEQKSRVFLGISPGLTLEVSLLGWLALYLDAGVDFTFNSHDYTLDDGTSVYSYRFIQPNVFIGVRFWFFN